MGILDLGGTGNLVSYAAQESLLMLALYVRFLQPTVAIQKNTSQGVLPGVEGMNATIIDPRTVIYDAPVIVRKEALLQRIADYVRQGYVYHVSGTVAVHKAPALAQKFRDYYRVDLDRNARYRRKRLGQANAELLLYSAADPNAHLVWVLLVTNGLHPAHHAERLKDARERGQRLVVTGYELVRQPRHGSSAAAWTWRIEDEQVQTWRYRLKSLIRTHGDAELQRAWWSLTHAPGFSAIRKQTRGIMTFAKSEWKRSRAKTEQWPFRASIRLSYVRRITHQTRPLTALMRERMLARTQDEPTAPPGGAGT